MEKALEKLSGDASGPRIEGEKEQTGNENPATAAMEMRLTDDDDEGTELLDGLDGEMYFITEQEPVITFEEPIETKRKAIWKSIMTKPLSDILRLAMMTTLDPEKAAIGDIVNAATEGKMKMTEDTDDRNAYQSVNGDVMQAYIQAVRVQGYNMDENLAAERDLLSENWDFRDPDVRRLHKMKTLIAGSEDTDLYQAIHDLEKLYFDKKEDASNAKNANE